MQVVGRTGKFTWRMLAMVLVGQSILLFFGALVARGFARADGGEGTAALLVGTGIAALAVLAAGLMRGPLGLPLGWLVQILTWVAAWWVPMMVAVGLIFTGLWVWCLAKGTKVDQESTARSDAHETSAPGR